MPELKRRRHAPYWLVLSALPSIACGQRLTDEECGKLLDHYTGLLIQEENPGAAPELVAAKQAQARAVADQDARFEFSACPKRVSRRGYDCAMRAPSVDEVERCLVF